tara:strand:- start:274 stop:483 length:210 start_codon:yes stop_codon:yes gene_type:complete
MKITKKVLQAQLNQLNKTTGRDYELDHAACYGGYCLTANNGSSHLIGRMAANKMHAYLMGALDWVSHDV